MQVTQLSVLGLLVLSSSCCCRAFTSPLANPGFIKHYSYSSHKSASLKDGRISRPSRSQLSVAPFPSDPLGSPGEVSSSKQLRKKTLQTFPRYLEIECWKQPSVRGLEPVLQAVAEACQQINRIVQRAQTDDVYGVAEDAAGNPLETNVQGEVQQKLDVLCNTIMLRAFCGSSRNVIMVATEEEDEPRCCCDVMVRALNGRT
jgi:hypothetical protein